LSYERAVELENYMVIEVSGKNFEFEDGLFYEVEFKGYDEYMQSIYERTGNAYNHSEINEMA